MAAARTGKQALLEAVIVQMEGKLGEMRAGFDAARDAVLSAPHVMKGKREVFGQESAYLANALSLNIQEREHELKILQSLHLPDTPERVALGCLVGVGPEGGSPSAIYLLLPVCGGMEISVSTGAAVRVITPGTPIAKALLGKSMQDEVRLPNMPEPQCIRLLQ